MRTNRPKLLLDERPLFVLPQLAVAVGLEEAIIAQQLNYLLRESTNGKEIDGKRWIYNTYEEWRTNWFPFWSERTIQRTFLRMEALGWIETIQPDGVLSRRKYYTLSDQWYAHIEGKEDAK